MLADAGTLGGERTVFREAVNEPGQYGPRLAATTVYVQVGKFLPEARPVAVFGHVFVEQVLLRTMAGLTCYAARP